MIRLRSFKPMILVSIVLMLSLAMFSCSSPGTNGGSGNGGSDTESKVSIGDFDTKDLQGNQVTQDVFAENDITLVNVFSVTCRPCMMELPHLAELAEEYASSEEELKVGIIGLNLDAAPTGTVDERLAATLGGVVGTEPAMTVIFPDQNLNDSIVRNVQAIPHTIFVDNEGNIVGETYLGARDKDDWKAIISKEVANLSR